MPTGPELGDECRTERDDSRAVLVFGPASRECPPKRPTPPEDCQRQGMICPSGVSYQIGLRWLTQPLTACLPYRKSPAQPGRGQDAPKPPVAENAAIPTSTAAMRRTASTPSRHMSGRAAAGRHEPGSRERADQRGQQLTAWTLDRFGRELDCGHHPDEAG
jgi:hypothetical protein